MLFFLHQSLAIEKKCWLNLIVCLVTVVCSLFYLGLIISSLRTSSLSLDYTLHNRVQALESNCLIEILVLPVIGNMTLGNSEPQFPHMCNGDDNFLISLSSEN